MEKKVSSPFISLLLVSACGRNGSYADAFPEPELYRLQAGVLLLAAFEEDILCLEVDTSKFVESEKADLEDEDLVVGIFNGGEAKAYPVRLLSLHEVVSDQVGDQEIALTRSPLCYSAVVFDRIVNWPGAFFRASPYFLRDIQVFPY